MRIQQGLIIPLLLLQPGLCWSLPQDAHSGSLGHAEGNYDLYVDFDDDYYNDYNDEPQAQPQIDNPPVFVEDGQRLQVGEGDSVIFNCATIKPNSYPMIIKKLTKDGNEGQLFYVGDVKIHRDRRIDLKDGLLNITMIRERDQGDYICYYEGNPVVQVIHTLAVYSAPKILFHSDDVSISHGESLTLECTIEGNPQPRVEWQRSEGFMPSGRHKEEGSVLKLDGLNKNIAGTYICKAENNLGMASETVSVTYKTVQDKTVSVTSKNIQDQSIKLEKVITQTGWDTTLKLICTDPSGLASSFRWEKDGNTIEQDPNARIVLTEQGGQQSTISLPLMSSDDFGNYTCITGTGLESTRSTIFVDDQPREAVFTSDPEGSEDTSYRLTWGTESNSPVIWYMVSIRNLANTSSEATEPQMFQNAEALAEDNIYTISHELEDLTPDTEYEVFIQVNNKFRWSEPSSFQFTTKRDSSRDSSVLVKLQPTLSRESVAPAMPLPTQNQETAIPSVSQSNSSLESVVTVMPRTSQNLNWCEWPLTTVGSECFFFSDLVESEDDSQSKNNWENAQQFCEENGGNLAQLTNTLEQYFNQDRLTSEKYWIGGKRVYRNEVRWLNGHLVGPDWIVNVEESQNLCLQYWPSENRLGMGSCEERYRWICEKPDPFSQELEINIFREEDVKQEESRKQYENQQGQIVNVHQDERKTKSQRNQSIIVRNEDSITKPQKPLNEQEQNIHHQHLTQEQQLQILEQQVQLELERQQNQHQQQLLTSQQHQPTTIPPQQEIIQKLIREQLEAKKRQKSQQKQKQSTKVREEPTIPGVKTVHVEQRPYEQDTQHELNRVDTLAKQEVSTTNKESVGEFQPLRYMCPPNFLRLGNSCYYFGSEMLTWHAAHFACRDRDSQMITLENQWEDITIRHYLSKPEFARLNRWVGGIYNWSTKRWMWGPSGEVMPYLGFLTSAPPTSSRWHCVFMAPSLNYRWNHELCTTQMHYICESPQSKIPDSDNIGYAQ